MNDITTQFNNSYQVCTCPNCNSTTFIRSGFDRGIQRYLCKSCHKTFKATAGTPVHGLHKKEKTAKYIEALREGISVRKAAKYVGISTNTAFAWRHRFLSSLGTPPLIRTANKISSADIIQLEYSAKGRRKHPEKHTSPTRSILLYRESQLEIHKLAPVRHTSHFSKILSENPAHYFATPPHKTITAGIKHSANAIKIKNQKIRQPLIAKVKQQTIKLLCWMERFKGVASKYLQNYWNWYASLFNLNQLKKERLYFYKICTNSRNLAKYFIEKQI